MREDVEQLSVKKLDILNSVVENLLLIMKRFIPDLETAVGFLTTR